MRRLIAIAAVLLLGATALAACGGSDDDGMGHMDGGMHRRTSAESNRAIVPGARELTVTAESLTFTPNRLEVQAGEDVTIVLTAEDIEHDFYVDGVGHVVHARAGRTAQGGLVLDKPGVYDFWCTIPGHKAGGMVGTITVTA